MAQFKVAVVVGSNRRDSINRKLAQALVKLAPADVSFQIAQIDDLPIYNQDNEGNLPAPVARFKGEIEAADGVLFVTPEYNRSIPTVLKNAIDWGARPWGKSSWAGKVVAVTGTSPGAISTALAQQHLRQIMGALGTLLVGGEYYIQFKQGLVDDAGNITDDGTTTFLQGLVDQLSSLVARFAQGAKKAA